MSKTVVGIFPDESRAKNAIDELKEKGFDDNEISLVARNETRNAGGEGTELTMEDQNLSDGTITGGAIGGLAGWLAGAGALLIPGIGPIIAAGPLAAALTGVVTGGIAGGLIDFGVPEERGEYYEERVREGNILLTLRSSEDKINEAADILREHGAQDVEVH